EIETFHPERMASRILGMGDVLTLIEKAQTNVDEKQAKQLEEKMRTMSLTFDDFLEQMGQVKQMGQLDDLLSMIPGAGKKQLKNITIDDHRLVQVEEIIQSTIRQERQDPSIMNASRKKRIAKGSGTNVSQVNRLLKQFNEMNKMMKQMTNMQKGKKGKGKGMPFPFM